MVLVNKNCIKFTKSNKIFFSKIPFGLVCQNVFGTDWINISIFWDEYSWFTNFWWVNCTKSNCWNILKIKHLILHTMFRLVVTVGNLRSSALMSSLPLWSLLFMNGNRLENEKFFFFLSVADKLCCCKKSHCVYIKIKDIRYD